MARVSRTGVKVLGLYGGLHGEKAPEKGSISRSYLDALGFTIAAGTV